MGTECGGAVEGGGRRGSAVCQRTVAGGFGRRDVVHAKTHATARLARRTLVPAGSQHPADAALTAGRESAGPRH